MKNKGLVRDQAASIPVNVDVYINNYIGADNTSQIIPVKIIAPKLDTDFDCYNFLLVLFDWYYTHLYPYQKNYKKNFNIPVFLDSINARNREKMIANLRVFLRIHKLVFPFLHRLLIA